MSKPDNQVNELHLRDPKPGDFWHERFCPYHIVLAVTPAGVVIADKTKPDGDSHYTFDLESAREITHEEHAKAVRYSSGSGFAADVVPVRAALSAREWKAAGSKYIAVAEQKAAPHAGEALMDTNKMRELKALAEAATQSHGAWRVEVDHNGVHVIGDGSWKILSAWHTPDGKGAQNAEFAAAASPATILALLAEINGLHAQHGRDSAEMRRLCRARDDAKWELNHLKGELESVLKNYRSLSASTVSLNCSATVMGDELAKLKAENEALHKDAGNWKAVLRAMEQLKSDEQGAAIWSACSRILISLASDLNSARSVVTEEGVTKDGAEIGDWRVTVERLAMAKEASHG